MRITRFTANWLVLIACIAVLAGFSESFDVRAGDTVCIPPGTPHRIRNAGAAPLRSLCACRPAYPHDDTELL
jgi:mannose-6-phosphate isomerase-like protein (cupin superfamily)